MIKNVIVSGMLAIIATGLWFLSGCGGSVTPSLTEQQKAAKTLAEGSPWGGRGKVEVVDVPTGVDPSGLAELTLVFSTSGDPEWEPTDFDASGADEFLATSNSSWKWGGFGTAIITLVNASSTELTGVDITEPVITVTFEINTGGGGGARVTGLDGTYTVKLQRNE